MAVATIEMTPTQQRWINDKTRELLIEGSAGSGKTIFACLKVIKYGLENKDASIYIYRKTLPSLKRTSLKEVIQLLDKYHIPYEQNKSEGTIKLLQTNSIMYFGALDSISKVRSINADLIYIEQAEELGDTEFYTELMLRLGRGEASKRPDGYAQMLIVVQPEDEEHWIYKRYHEYEDATTQYEMDKQAALREGKPYKSYDEILAEIQARRKSAHFHYSENLKLPKYQRDYYEQLKYEDYDLWLRYSAGQWGKLSNVIYPNYDTVVTRENYDFYSFGIDFGFNNPSAFLLIGWYDNEAYVIDEVYERELTTSELISKCNDMLFEHKLLPEHLNTGYADAAEPDRIEEFSQAGYLIEKSIKDVNAKINTTKQTKIHIHPRCVNTIKEIKGYIYKKNKDGVVLEEPIKVNDHAMDALGYACYGVRGALSPNRPVTKDFYKKVRVY